MAPLKCEELRQTKCNTKPDKSIEETPTQFQAYLNRRFNLGNFDGRQVTFRPFKQRSNAIPQQNAHQTSAIFVQPGGTLADRLGIRHRNCTCVVAAIISQRADVWVQKRYFSVKCLSQNPLEHVRKKVEIKNDMTGSENGEKNIKIKTDKKKQNNTFEEIFLVRAVAIHAFAPKDLHHISHCAPGTAVHSVHSSHF